MRGEKGVLLLLLLCSLSAAPGSTTTYDELKLPAPGLGTREGNTALRLFLGSRTRALPRTLLHAPSHPESTALKLPHGVVFAVLTLGGAHGGGWRMEDGGRAYLFIVPSCAEEEGEEKRVKGSKCGVGCCVTCVLRRMKYAILLGEGADICLIGIFAFAAPTRLNHLGVPSA